MSKRNRSGIWGFKAWSALVAVAVGVAVLQTAACTPAAPSNINIINNNTNTNTNGQSGKDSAEPTVKGHVTSDTKSVTVNGMKDGEKCPSGIVPANQNKKIRLGCELAVTVNPRTADGTVILDDHAPAVDFFVLATGQDVVTFSQSASNSYNGDVKTTKAGKFALLASVVGISSGLQEFEVIP